MGVDPGIRNGHQDPGSARDLMSFVHLEEGQMPLVLSDLGSIPWRGWLHCLD